jgi:uncharacterized protein
MKLHLSHSPGLHMISACGVDYVIIGGQRHESSLIVLPDRLLSEWGVLRFESLTPEHFADLAALTPELVLLGTGARQRFPHPSLYADLISAGIGIEVMNTGAACRTYNILAAEGRRVAAALIID